MSWVRQAVSRTPTIESLEPDPVPERATLRNGTKARSTPRPGPIAAPPRLESPSPVAAIVSPSTVQIAAMLDRAVYRGELVDKLVDALHEHIASAKRPGDRLFLSTLLRAVTNEGVDLPAMPEVVIKIQKLLANAECDITQLARTLSLEPMVTTKLIGVASSPIFGRGMPVRSLHDALMRIGLRETKNIVMAILSRTKLFKVSGFERDGVELYRRSLASSLAMQILARPLGLDPDEAFLAGLVHDLGELTILEAAAEVRRQSRGNEHVDYDLLEKVAEELHAPLGGLIAETWEFDPRIVTSIENHHTPDRAPRDAQVLADALFLSDEIAQQVIDQGDSQAILEPHPAFAILGIDKPEVLTEQARLSFQAFESAMKGSGTLHRRH
ncbi:HDOD domain-containing protein [Myxococcota bacterium]|nr:HDOD domain-containing protein [Myxococcota bacterium]